MACLICVAQRIGGWLRVCLDRTALALLCWPRHKAGMHHQSLPSDLTSLEYVWAQVGMRALLTLPAGVGLRFVASATVTLVNTIVM
jgi:hypothetical protein